MAYYMLNLPYFSQILVPKVTYIFTTLTDNEFFVGNKCAHPIFHKNPQYILSQGISFYENLVNLSQKCF